MNIANWLCYAVGYVFITSGILKLVLTNELGFRSHFYELGVPFPDSTLYLVAIIEIGCGALIAAGMYVKNATIPLLVIMAGAIYFSKLPILISSGFLVFAFQSRLDIIVIILLLLLFRHVRGKRF